MKPSKKLYISLTERQINSIKKFLLKHKIKCDGKTEFGLIAEPRINEEELIIRLLTISEFEKIDKFLQKNGLYNEV